MRVGMFLLLTACAGAPAVTTTVTSVATVPTSTTATTAQAAQELFYAGVDQEPVAIPQAGSAAYLSPIAVVILDGSRYLAVNGFDDDPAERGVLLFEETSGSWRQAAGPIAVDLEQKEPGPIGSSLVQGPDGTWFLYGWGSPLGEPESSIVWLATATDLFGEWTAVSEPVLVKGGAGEWDDEGVLFPSVVITEEGFTMLYDGFGSLEGDHVGLAHSTDGVRWEKYNDLTTGGAFEESDPVFGPDPDGDFDARSVQVGRLVATPAAWVLVYMGLPPGRGPSQVGVATSPDLVNWDRQGLGLREVDIPAENLGLHTVEGAYRDDQVEVFVEVLTDVDSAVWRATAPLEMLTG